MKERILQFLTSEKISPAEFADKIGVQRSSMSHILNGRNYPSASFIQKMLQAYPLVNSRWLMIGEGSMNIEIPGGKEEIRTEDSGSSMNSLLNQTDQNVNNMDRESGMHSIPKNKIVSEGLTTNISSGAQVDIAQTVFPEGTKNTPLTGLENSIGCQKLEDETSQGNKGSNQPSSFPVYLSIEKEIEQVLFFYKDKTFMVYRPS